MRRQNQLRLFIITSLFYLCSCVEKQVTIEDTQTDNETALIQNGVTPRSKNFCQELVGQYESIDGVIFSITDDCKVNTSYCDTQGEIQLNGTLNAGPMQIKINNIPWDEQNCLQEGIHDCFYTYSNETFSYNCSGHVSTFFKQDIIIEIPRFSIFNYWSNDYFAVDLRDVENNEPIISEMPFYVSTSWLDYVHSIGRNVEGITPDDIISCPVQLTVTQSESNPSTGFITINVEDTNLPINNACMEYDNDCLDDGCNIESKHLYLITPDNKLYINWFGFTDNNIGVTNYPSEFLE